MYHIIILEYLPIYVNLFCHEIGMEHQFEAFTLNNKKWCALSRARESGSGPTRPLSAPSNLHCATRALTISRKRKNRVIYKPD